VADLATISSNKTYSFPKRTKFIYAIKVKNLLQEYALNEWKNEIKKEKIHSLIFSLEEIDITGPKIRNI
jgi:hypothetical protein